MAKKETSIEREMREASQNFSRVKSLALKLQEKYPERCVYCGKNKSVCKKNECLFH